MNELAEFLADIVPCKDEVQRHDFIQELTESIDENRFYWLYRDEKCIGFYTWIETIKDGNQWIYVGNLFIDPKERHPDNCRILKKSMQKRFPNAFRFYWHKEDTNKFVYLK